jgi:protocatechuate 3,4-dioxygenase beta subunit
MRVYIALAIVQLAACVWSTPAQPSVPIVGRPCEGCQVALEALPQRLFPTAQLAPRDEPGEPLRLTGRVMDAAQRPRKGVIVYAYQTDRTGIYPAHADPSLSDEARRHGRLRAWAMTDEAGRYTFLTIRPGGYPGSDLPQHIHLHVIEPGCATYYIDDVMFRDDPRLTPRFISRMDVGRGGSGIVTPVREGTEWQVRRDIELGRNIPDYPGCPAPRSTDTP